MSEKTFGHYDPWRSVLILNIVLKCWALITQWHPILSQRNGNLMVAFFGHWEARRMWKQLPQAPQRCMFLFLNLEKIQVIHILYTHDRHGWCTCSGNRKLLERGEKQLRGPTFYISGFLLDLWLKKIHLTNCSGYIHWVTL